MFRRGVFFICLRPRQILEQAVLDEPSHATCTRDPFISFPTMKNMLMRRLIYQHHEPACIFFYELAAGKRTQ